MGYAYDKVKSVTQHSKRAGDSLNELFNAAGLKSEQSEIGDAIHLKVSDPTSGNRLELDINEYFALADGYWHTGQVVQVNSTPGSSFPVYEELENCPDMRSDANLNISMQGAPTNDTTKVAEKIISKLKTPQI